jgi:hypothetical protein
LCPLGGPASPTNSRHGTEHFKQWHADDADFSADYRRSKPKRLKTRDQIRGFDLSSDPVFIRAEIRVIRVPLLGAL